jgi:hypothetical protein
MDQTRPGGGAGWDDEPHGQPRQPSDQEPPGGAPASNFPTFGQTPGWQDEPAQAPRQHDQPYGVGYEQPYGQPYDQGYAYPGYAYEQPQPPVPYPAYGGYAPYAAPRYAETETGSIVALVLAILSWVVCPVILAIPALIVGSNSKAKIRSFPERYSGLGMITAANWIAWINIGLFVGGGLLIGLIAIASSGPS